MLAYFELAAHESLDPGTVADHAQKFAAAGYRIDSAQLSELSGYRLTEAKSPHPISNRVPGVQDYLPDSLATFILNDEARADGSVTKRLFDESKHPRAPKGNPQGGEFIAGGGAPTPCIQDQPSAKNAGVDNDIDPNLLLERSRRYAQTRNDLKKVYEALGEQREASARQVQASNAFSSYLARSSLADPFPSVDPRVRQFKQLGALQQEVRKAIQECAAASRYNQAEYLLKTTLLQPYISDGRMIYPNEEILRKVYGDDHLYEAERLHLWPKAYSPGDIELHDIVGALCLQLLTLPFDVPAAAELIGAFQTAKLGAAAESALNGKISNLRTITAEEANYPFIRTGKSPPFAPNTFVREFEVVRELSFVRVHGENNPRGYWLVRADEIRGMSPQQIQKHLALPKEPTQVQMVTVPKGQTLQVGRVGTQPQWGVSANGGIKYRVTRKLPKSSFQKSIPLNP